MTDQPLLRLADIWKRFGATTALAGAGLNLATSEIHALVGANGAGKSTLARIIAGNIRPDSGTLEIDGRSARLTRARDAIRAGISIVTQETSLAPDLSVFENIMLPRMGLSKRLNWRSMRKTVTELLARFDQSGQLALDQQVRNLSIGQRQIVEMLRALALDSRIIIFDEPTASLSPRESERLFDVMRSLAVAGHGLIFVTHRLEEVFTVSDRITVLREGKVTADAMPTRQLTEAEIIRFMVGRELSDIYARGTIDTNLHGSCDIGRKVMLSVRHLASPPRVRDVSFDVHRGEILGLAGLIGAGRSETVETIFGLRAAEAGEILCEGQPLVPNSPRDAIRAGIGFVPEDRRAQGVIPDFSVKENLLAAHLGARRGGMLGYGERRSDINRLLKVLGLPAERVLDSNLLNFSGGMQQKVILARWLILSPKLLLLDEPTRGVDIATRSSIYALLRKVAAEGVACVLISSDFEEVLGLADRVVVISDGKTVANISSKMVDVEKLAMFAAPRSSADRTHALLEKLAAVYGGIAFLARVEGSHVFCFDRVGVDLDADPGFGAGEIEEVGKTRIVTALRTDGECFVREPDGSRHTLLVPIVGRMGHVFGLIGLCLRGAPALITAAKLRNEIVASLNPQTGYVDL